jgi:predicted nucleic acid-binding protein
VGNAVFIDANVLLEAILLNRLRTEKARDYIGSHQVVISPLSAHLFAYFGQKDGMSLELLLGLLSEHRFTDIGSAETMWAIRNHQGNDFEDALQVASAVLAGCKQFVTLDRSLAQHYGQFIEMVLL